MKRKYRNASMMTLIFFVVAVLFASSAVPQPSDKLKEYFSQGVDLYRQKDYEGALAAFLKAQDIAQTGALFYNMGNCYLRTGRIGQAILYYEKALEHMPGDPDLQHNMSYARGLLKDSIVPRENGFFRTMQDAMAARFTAKGLVLFSLAVFAVASAVAVPFYIFRPRRRIAVVALLSLCVMACGLVAQGALVRKQAARGVITASMAEARFGPGETVAFELHEGTTVHVLKEQDGWCLIRLEDGKTGYVSRDALVLIF
jgi:hypothetical protein